MPTSSARAVRGAEEGMCVYRGFVRVPCRHTGRQSSSVGRCGRMFCARVPCDDESSARVRQAVVVIGFVYSPRVTCRVVQFSVLAV